MCIDRTTEKGRLENTSVLYINTAGWVNLVIFSQTKLSDKKVTFIKDFIHTKSESDKFLSQENLSSKY